MTMAVVGTVVGVASIGAGLYESSQQAGVAQQGINLSAATQAKQNQYNTMLMDLMKDPSTFFKNPVFQSTLSQGLAGVSRQLAAQGYLGSGNEMTALEQYGQTFAEQQLLSQEQLLASLSGAQTASPPASGLGVASGALSAGSSQLGDTLASLGYMYGNLAPSYQATSGYNDLVSSTIAPDMSSMWSNWSPSIGASVPGG